MDETKRMHKGFKIFILVFIAIILIIIQISKETLTLPSLNKDAKIEKILNKEKVYNGGYLHYFNSVLIKWENNLITFLNEDGSNKWVKEFGFVEPTILFGKDNLYILDNIFRLDSNGDTTLRLQLNKPIFNMKESNKNIIIHSREGNAESLEFINSNGKKLNSLITEERILTYSMQEDRANYVYSTISVKGSGVISKLYFNTFENKNKYSVEFLNEIIIYSEFYNNGILVITDSGVYNIDSGNIKWSVDYPLIKDFQIFNDKIYILSDKYLEILDLNGKNLNKVSCEVLYNKISTMDKYIILYGSKNLVILQEGKEVLKYTTEGVVKKITGDNSKIYISYEDKLEVYGFK